MSVEIVEKVGSSLREAALAAYEDRERYRKEENERLMRLAEEKAVKLVKGMFGEGYEITATSRSVGEVEVVIDGVELFVKKEYFTPVGEWMVYHVWKCPECNKEYRRRLYSLADLGASIVEYERWIKDHVCSTDPEENYVTYESNETKIVNHLKEILYLLGVDV